MSISDKLTRLASARNSIISALGSKGVTATGHGFEDFPDDIAAITSGSGGFTITEEPDSHGGTIKHITGTSTTVQPLEVTQNGTYTATSGYAYSPVTVNVSGGGGASVSAKDVNFIDYDGTILYSYTAAEFANLDALPDNPSHDGLTAQGWNWTLADAKMYVANYGKLWIGQMYVTTSGDTEVEIVLEEGRLSPYLGIAVNGLVTVDWGDNSTPDTVSGTSLYTQIRTLHNYANAGAYKIIIRVNSGSFAFYGTTTYPIMSKQSGVLNENRVYGATVKTVRLGNNVTIGNYAFSYCTNLDTITIPSSITSMDGYAFYYCYNINSITIPNNVTSISNYAFMYCTGLNSIAIPNGITSIGTYAFSSVGLNNIAIPSNVTSLSNYVFSGTGNHLTTVVLPNGITSIGTYAFSACTVLNNIIIPSNVTSIASYAFRYCYGLGEIHFKSTTPPAVANSNAWTSIPTDCTIYVPAGSLSAYTSATNYPSSATYTYVEE